MMVISSVRSRVADVPQRHLLSAAGAAAATAAAAAFYCSYNKRGEREKTTADPEDTTGLQDPVCEQAPQPAPVQPTEVLRDQMTVFLTEAEEKHQKSVETIAQLEEEKSNLTNQVEKLKEKVENMKNDLCKAYTECVELRKEFVRERKTYRLLQSDYRKKEKTLIYQDNILKVSSLANAKNQKRNAVETMIQLEEEKLNLTNQVKELRGTLENMKNNLFKMNRRHDELVDMCMRERGAYSILQAENDKMKTTLIHQKELPKEKHQKSVETITEVEEKKSTLTNQVERLSQKVEVKKNNLFKTYSEHDELMKECMREQKFYSALLSDDNKIQKTLLYQDKFLKVSPVEAKEKHQNAVKTINQLVNETFKQTNHVEELRGTLENMKNDLFKSDSERDELMDVSLAKAKKKHQKAVETIALLEKGKYILTKHFESLRRTVEDVKDELFETRRECDELMDGHGGLLEPIPAIIGRKAGVHPGQVASPLQGHTYRRRTTLTPKSNLDSPINLTYMFLDCGRKPEYPEETHACTGRTSKLHTERPHVFPGESVQQQEARSVLQSEKMRKQDIQKVANKKTLGAYGDHCSHYMSEV